jgi:hypothetical protein
LGMSALIVAALAVIAVALLGAVVLLLKGN